MRPPGYSTILSCAILALLTGPAASETLYLGQQEVDTSHEGAMESVIARCAGLAADSPDARTAASFTRKQSAAPTPLEEVATGDEQAEFGSTVLSLGQNGRASSGESPATTGEAAGAGEGGVEATLPPAGSAEDSEGINLEDVTLGACKEAGLVY